MKKTIMIMVMSLVLIMATVFASAMYFSQEFEDLKIEHWAFGPIQEMLYKRDLVIDSNEFRPDDYITYGELSQFVGCDTSGHDANGEVLRGYAAYAIYTQHNMMDFNAENNDVMKDGRMYEPATRAEVAQMLVRIIPEK